MATVMENIPFAIDPKLSSCTRSTATSESDAKIERKYTGEKNNGGTWQHTGSVTSLWEAHTPVIADWRKEFNLVFCNGSVSQSRT